MTRCVCDLNRHTDEQATWSDSGTYEFEMANEINKNICREKGEGALESKYNNWIVQEISFGLQEPRWSGKISWLKTVDSDSMHQAIR